MNAIKYDSITDIRARGASGITCSESPHCAFYQHKRFYMDPEMRDRSALGRGHVHLAEDVIQKQTCMASPSTSAPAG